MHHLEKIPQERVAMLSEDRLRMELHAKGRMLPVPEAHDFSVIAPRRDFQFWVFRSGLHNQRMIAPRIETVGKASENTGCSRDDLRRIPRHGPLGASNPAAERLANA